ncbi:MAG: hypothetical protein RL235_798 [Chlamydiota bacterium]
MNNAVKPSFSNDVYSASGGSGVFNPNPQLEGKLRLDGSALAELRPCYRGGGLSRFSRNAKTSRSLRTHTQLSAGVLFKSKILGKILRLDGSPRAGPRPCSRGGGLSRFLLLAKTSASTRTHHAIHAGGSLSLNFRKI